MKTSVEAINSRAWFNKQIPLTAISCKEKVKYSFKIPHWRVPKRYKSWVLDDGSLTERLKKASSGEFSVRITRHGWGNAKADERYCLPCNVNSLALIREVELICCGVPWVTARSIIPVSTLTGKERCLKHLGTKPLGEFLFKSRHMSRSPIEPFICNMDGQHLYGRRSVFFLHNKPLLVSETFLPALFESVVEGN